MKPAATMENFPEELKLEILLRLPVKSLVSLRCVSKSWRSIISNPNFAKLHLQRCNYSQYPNRIIIPNSPQMKSIDMNTSLHNDSDTFNHFLPPFKPYNQVCVLGSCRGIVLLRTLRMNLFMWNPMTGDYKKIALPPRLKSPIPFAFCYDESLDDYFIGLSSYCYDYDAYRIPDLFEVLSVRTNSWQNLDLHHHCTTMSLNRSGAIFNGAIHFTANSDYISPQIIAFDITTKGLRKVPPPIGTNLECAGLGIHKGCLALTCASRNEIQVWVTRAYGVKPSWTKLFSVYQFQKSDIWCLRPLVFFKEGDEFVLPYHTKDRGEGLSKWNDKGELLEHRASDRNLRKTYPYAEAFMHAIAHTDTLLPLP